MWTECWKGADVCPARLADACVPFRNRDDGCRLKAPMPAHLKATHLLWGRSPRVSPSVLARCSNVFAGRGAYPKHRSALHEVGRFALTRLSSTVRVGFSAHARRPTIRAWAIIRRADRAHRLTGQRTSRPECCHADRADRTSPSQQPQERGMVADAR